MKKIEYYLKPYFKVSVFDMTIDIIINGYIIYRKKQCNIKTIKTHTGPKFIFEYYLETTENMEKLLEFISPELIKIVNNNLISYNGDGNEWTGIIDTTDLKTNIP